MQASNAGLCCSGSSAPGHLLLLLPGKRVSDPVGPAALCPLQSLAALLGGGPALAASVLSQQPSLLLLSAAALERKLVELVKATGLARAKAADMCVREPLLLTLRCDRTRQRPRC